MANLLNNLLCSTALVGNTGINQCTLNPDIIRGAIMVPSNFELTFSDAGKVTWDGTEYDSTHEALQAAVVAVASKRIYPIGMFGDFTDNSSEPTVNTTGYGDESVTNGTKYKWVFSMADKYGSVCLRNKIATFNDRDYKALFIDENWVLFGTSGTGIKGIKLGYIYADEWKAATGGAKTGYMVRFAIPDAKQINENIAFTKFAVDPFENVKGIIDIAVESAAAATAGHAFVKIKTVCGGIDPYDSYADLLADPDAWVLTKAGVAKTITGVTKSDSLRGWDVASAETGACVLALAPADELATLGIGGGSEYGYEGANTYAVTLPS